MQVDHRNKDSVDIVELSGRLTMANASEVRQRLRAIIEQSSGKVIVDLKDVGFMDSSGLSALISAFKSARGKGGEMVLLHLMPAVRSLIELTRMHQVFDIFDDEFTAIAFLNRIEAGTQPDPIRQSR